MGIEAVKSSTPEVCRVAIKEAIKIVMNKEETDLHNYIAKFREEYKQYEPEQIAFPRSCNNLRKYFSQATFLSKVRHTY